MISTIDSEVPMMLARTKIGALLMETATRKALRESDLRDGIWHNYEVHMMQAAEAGISVCFCTDSPKMMTVETPKPKQENEHGPRTEQPIR